MKIFLCKNQIFKKVKIESTYQESKRKRFNKIIIVKNNYIINSLVYFHSYFFNFSIYFFIKSRKIHKISENIFNEMISYINAHNTISLEEIYSFRQFNSEKKLIESNPTFQKSENPILTVIISTYNQAHCIHKCIRSIQNQSIKNIEILIMDDCSTDNTTETINEFQKEDPRIVLISHDMNEGPIKTRSDGVRFAKGNYY